MMQRYFTRRCISGNISHSSRQCLTNISIRPISSIFDDTRVIKCPPQHDVLIHCRHRPSRTALSSHLHCIDNKIISSSSVSSSSLLVAPSTSWRRHFSSSSILKTKKSNNNDTRTMFTYEYHYPGNNTANNNSTDADNSSNKPLLQFSKLTPRQSAEIEDILYTKIIINNNNDDDDDDNLNLLLLDPILQKSISRKGGRGLDWIQSISVPSSSSLVAVAGAIGSSISISDSDDSKNENGSSSDSNNSSSNKDSIVVSIQVPTLLHPKLHELATNIAIAVQTEVVTLLTLQQQQNYAKWFNNNTPDANDGEDGIISIEKNIDQQVGVTVIISPQPTTGQLAFTTTTNKQAAAATTNTSKALQNITHFLAVYSCKGGVGKSTIATNLAYQLSAMGGRVGLLDVDVYGPSLPLLVKPDDVTVRQSPPPDDDDTTSTSSIDMIEPIIHKNVKLMSLGFVSPNSGVPGSGHGPNSGGATVLRGPMAGRVVSQLLKGTNWKSLDVLVLDLPPGTGDVQLEVCQSLSLSGAVAVSTPSKLAWSDVRKGVEMFGELNVRTLGVVENMAYFECEGGGRHYPFGKARTSLLGDEDNEEMCNDDDDISSHSLADHYLPASSHFFHLPISSVMNDATEAGTPLCCIDNASSSSSSSSSDESSNTETGAGEEERATFAKLADAISTDLLLLQHGQTPLSVRDSGSHKGTGGKNALTVTITGEADGQETEFDVPLTQLSVDNNDSRSLMVRLFSNDGGYQKVISGRDLRFRDPRSGEMNEDALAEEAAVTVHQRSGGCGGSSKKQSPSMVEQYTSSNNSSDGLFPVNLTKKGNYGYEIEWTDKSKIIYSLLAIAMAAGGKKP